MSASMIAKAAALKPEIRLAQAVSEFEASLSEQHKATFRSYRSQSWEKAPESSDVMRFTAEIDLRTAQQTGGGQCFGPRLTNILQAAQQYAALGDVVIGGSQNIIACGVWSLLRLTLLALVSFSTYMDKLSKILMAAGRKAPRYQQMALLYPRSPELKSSMAEYFTVIVHLCQKLYKAVQKPAFSSYFAFLGDLELREHETSLQLWADCIKDEVMLLTARNVSEQATFLGSLSKNSQYESQGRRFQNRLRLLDACSTYDYETTWKEIQKSGNSTLLARLDQYAEWKAETTSSTLLCTGKLGFGKSVLLANMVAELNLSTKDTDTPVLYFFCRHDIQESLKARTIIGCLARQLISAILKEVPDVSFDSDGTANLDGLLEVVARLIPKTARAYLVLDGLDECNDLEKETTLKYLKKLQKMSSLQICCSFRSDVHLTGVGESAELLLGSRILQLPEDNPDISRFVTSELDRCIKSGRLSVGDPTLISDIQEALVNRAQGMFLWVILQIASLCTAHSDEEIREALENLPRGLPETFSRILEKSRGTGRKYQQLTFKLCIAARRPLTTEELREALSVSPYNIEWNPARLINDIFSVLSYCGSLIMVDEENLTVRFLHHSVKQFLLGDFDHMNKPGLTLEDADRAMGEVIVTYLNYNMFENAVSTTVTSEMMAQDLPAGIVKSTFRHSSAVRTVALKMLKRRKTYHHDLRNTLMRARKEVRQSMQLDFYAYAEAFWLWHLQWVFHQESTALPLLLRILEKKRVNINQKDAHGETLLWKAIDSASNEVVGQLLDFGANAEVVCENDHTLLHLAAMKCSADMVSILLDYGAQIDAKTVDGLTPLLLAASHGNQAAMERLIDRGADTSYKNKDESNALLLAASKGHHQIVESLIDRKKAGAIEFKNKDGRTAASLAAYRGHQAVLEYLIDQGAKLSTTDADGWTPLLLAAGAGHISVIKSLRKNGVNLEARDNDGWTALLWAAYKGHNDVIRYLLQQKVRIDAQDKEGWTPLLLAIAQGHETTVRLLIDRGATIKTFTNDGKSALEIAVDQGHHTIKILLLDRFPTLRTGSRGDDIDLSKDDGIPEKYSLGNLIEDLDDIRVHLDISQRADKRAAKPDGKRADREADEGAETIAYPEDDDAELEINKECASLPLLLAAARGDLWAVKFWMNQGKSIHDKTSTGRTVLHLSAERGFLSIVRYLLRNGADPKDEMLDGRNALHMVAAQGHVEIVDYLLDHGAILGTKTADGKSALSFAVEYGHGEVVKSLIQRGASVEDL